MHNDYLVNWLAESTVTGSPAYAAFSFLIHTTVCVSVTAILIILFKLIFKNKLPAKWHLAVWLILLVRLAAPALPSSPISIFNAAEIGEQTVEQASYRNVITQQGDNFEETDRDSGMTPENTDDNDAGAYNKAVTSAGYIMRIDVITVTVWICGAVIMAGYFTAVFAVYNRRLKKRRRSCDGITVAKLNVCKEKLNIKRKVRIYFADITPTLTGLFRPVVYLPEDCGEDEKENILLHELNHMKNLDVLYSVIATIVLCLNWFNPVIWISFFMFKRDIEVFCDERTLRCTADKQGYARTLLKTATAPGRKFVPGTTSFQRGKSDVKHRIKYMAKYKKPAAATVVMGAILICMISASCLTNAADSRRIFGVTDPVTNLTWELILDDSVINEYAGGGGSDFYYRETNADMETVIDSINKNNHNNFSIELLNDDEILLYSSAPYFQPCILLSKNVTDQNGKKLDNILVICSLGNYEYIPAHSGDEKMPNIEYGYYFPLYMCDNCFEYNTEDKSMLTESTNAFFSNIHLNKSYDFGDVVDFYRNFDIYRADYPDYVPQNLLKVKASSDKTELFDIHYDSLNNTVRFVPHPGFAAESAKSALYGYFYFDDMKSEDKDAFMSCFSEASDAEGVKALKNNLSKVKAASLESIEIESINNKTQEYSYYVNCSLQFSGNNISYKNKSRFTVRYIDFRPVITYTDIFEGD